MSITSIANLTVGDRNWILPAVAVAIAGVLLALVLNQKRLAQSPLGPLLRIVGWVLLCICLVYRPVRLSKGLSISFAFGAENLSGRLMAGTAVTLRSNVVAP